MFGNDAFTTLGPFLQKGQANNENPETKTRLRWTALGVLLALIGGAFGLGFKASSTVSQAEMEQLQLKIKTLEQQQEKLRREFQTSNKKEEFRTLSCRIKRGQEALDKSPSNNNLKRQVKADEQALATFIVQNKDQDKENGVPVMRVIKRETPAESAVKFDGDDKLYVVPQGVKKLTPPGTFLKADAGALENFKLYAPSCPKWEPIFTDSRIGQARSLHVSIAKIR